MDIGCGGGLISEPLARLGGKVTGIDASEKNIKIAKIHAKKNDLDEMGLCFCTHFYVISGSIFSANLEHSDGILLYF